jgi:predicted DNA repair protein MutK
LPPRAKLPIVGRIAWGSLRNKLLILLPLALALSYFWLSAIAPLLMIGGAYLCYEGTEKLYEAIVPHRAHAHEARVGSVALNPQTLEDEKVAGAIKTDFILSAEIMAIALSTIQESGLLTQAVVLALVGIGITAAVYGVVALIVKADDAGVALASNKDTSAIGAISRMVGRALVLGMPIVLTLLSIVGTAAMIWVGGGIIVHGLEKYGVGFTRPRHSLRCRSRRSCAAARRRSNRMACYRRGSGTGRDRDRRRFDSCRRIRDCSGLATAERCAAVAANCIGPLRSLSRTFPTWRRWSNHCSLSAERCANSSASCIAACWPSSGMTRYAGA